MTKEQYFEMCDMLGTEPKESEIPIELHDFHPDVRQAFDIYYLLRDVWDTMGGGYLGKDMSNIFEFLRLFKVCEEDWILTIDFIRTMDRVRMKQVADKQKAKEASSKKA